ncbi:MAG TPA: LuxR C-terminal-related transcriptional regulator [Acidimicrobiales bacterium]|nr:LuxR C-terminal-related transcriptional regulator [Acidimicrobiales bacterium]
MAAVAWDVPTPRAVVLDLTDATRSAALCFTVGRSGRPVDDRGLPESLVVSDRLDRSRTLDVLVCGPTAVDAAAAVAAFAAGQARAIVAADDPEQLVAALAALELGLSLVPADLLERARAVPALTDRQRAVLGGVLAGQSNAEMARALQVRPVTVKREVAGLFGAFGACRRFELMSVAFGLGFRADALRP